MINEYEIRDIDLSIARKINKKICEKYQVIPMKEQGDSIIVLSCNTKDDAKDYLRFIYNTNIIIKKITKNNYEYLKELIFEVDNKNLEEYLIYHAIDRKASDIHIEPKEKEVDVRYRINGTLVLVYKISISEYLSLSSKIKLKANMDISEKRKPQDGKMTINYNGSAYDLRLSSIPIVYGEKLVIRLLYCEKFDYKLEDLCFSQDKIELIRRIMALNNGLVIINGPTGSGKSTTLYTILKEINKEGINITTLEDPVEVLIPNINQMSLSKKLNIDFSNGLKNILRQDPDVIMIGEVRDEETAKIAVRSSITGHKVYTTIHCKSPRDVYLRLEDMGVKSYLIRDSVVGIISQRLVKTLCEECKQEDNENFYKGNKVYKKIGCKSCDYSGYAGRKLVSSVYFLNKKYDMEKLYSDQSYLSNSSMKKDLQNLLKKGEIPYDDYLRFIEGEGLSENI
ncbi:GspE/PulE family protein [Clostridium uliginosum]|uniref:Type IV pilus assembly protein PilB n=1 Tax=Clostridium uliginosum TaxID=119641 RepID=A0A1I1NFZ0_9CLOT|nr:GspE/PulE family protein [Clostridium uliginosum]SFC96316.1 type IV pilus assembly protein PilB [Clostridium uliginosum]